MNKKCKKCGNLIINCDYLKIYCNDCSKEKIKQYNLRLNIKYGECKNCGATNNYHAKGLCKKCYYKTSEHKERRKEWDKKYYIKNRDKILEYQKEWKKDNLEYNKKYQKDGKRKEYHKIYVKERRKTDIIFKLIHDCGCGLRTFLKKKNWEKETKTMNILGCSGKELKEHIEKQFKLGMAWNNQGHGWHIDHIIPLALVKTKEQLKYILNYRNLQPMWSKENLRKSNKISKEWGNFEAYEKFKQHFKLI